MIITVCEHRAFCFMSTVSLFATATPDEHLVLLCKQLTASLIKSRDCPGYIAGLLQYVIIVMSHLLSLKIRVWNPGDLNLKSFGHWASTFWNYCCLKHSRRVYRVVQNERKVLIMHKALLVTHHSHVQSV